MPSAKSQYPLMVFRVKVHYEKLAEMVGVPGSMVQTLEEVSHTSIAGCIPEEPEEPEECYLVLQM